jgi:DNA invertase Pin-like site-specific DNA recombinase
LNSKNVLTWVLCHLVGGTPERTKSGLQAARSRGKKGGRPTKKEDKVEMAVKMYKSKDYTIKQITVATGISKTTLYRYLDKAL